VLYTQSAVHILSCIHHTVSFHSCLYSNISYMYAITFSYWTISPLFPFTPSTPTSILIGAFLILFVLHFTAWLCVICTTFYCMIVCILSAQRVSCCWTFCRLLSYCNHTTFHGGGLIFKWDSFHPGEAFQISFIHQTVHFIWYFILICFCDTSSSWFQFSGSSYSLNFDCV